jgi:hypothetical protein
MVGLERESEAILNKMQRLEYYSKISRDMMEAAMQQILRVDRYLKVVQLQAF